MFTHEKAPSGAKIKRQPTIDKNLILCSYFFFAILHFLPPNHYSVILGRPWIEMVINLIAIACAWDNCLDGKWEGALALAISDNSCHLGLIHGMKVVAGERAEIILHGMSLIIVCMILFIFHFTASFMTLKIWKRKHEKGLFSAV